MISKDRLGSRQVGSDPDNGKVEFGLFFPDNKRAPDQYSSAGKSSTYGDPQIQSIRVTGDFQHHLGQTDWDAAHAPSLTRTQHPKGWVWRYETPAALPSDFYEYKYHITFMNGQQRYVGDPHARYGGSSSQNSAFVVGGSSPAQNTVPPVAGGRRHLRDLIVYELMIDDFTDEYRAHRAPLDAVRDKLDYLRSSLGINAILFMPWTAWPGEGFSWGYTPSQYFSIEYRYANALNSPSEKLSKLKKLIADCHQRGIHVIMDGVFNHVGDVELDAVSALGFPYRWLYQNPSDSPYCGVFGGTFPGLLELDYNNHCTQEFIGDVCLYWIDTFGIDGIRFDNTVNFHIHGRSEGLPKLCQDIRSHVADGNFSLIHEHLELDAAIVTNNTDATSYWNNELYSRTFDYLWNRRIDSQIMGALNSHLGLSGNRVATTYIGNHDHSHVAWQAGGPANRGALDWYLVQPYAIALLTMPGSPMIQNGQEFAEDYWIMENDYGTGRRVQPRPLRWSFCNDGLGAKMRDVYSRLISIREKHPGLRSDNIYPVGWETWQTRFNPEGYGVDTEKGVVIFHRWGHDAQGLLQRFIIVLNFSPRDQQVDIPFSCDGVWRDLLNNRSVSVTQCRRSNCTVESNWGHVYFQ